MFYAARIAGYTLFRRHPKRALYQMPGLPILRIVFLGIEPSGLPFSLSSNVIPNGLLTQSLSKANFVCFWLF
jgi:hypothetical protein